MQVINDVHRQFAEYFTAGTLKPYLYLLSKKLSDGHICLNVDEIDKEELASAGYGSVLTKKELQKEPLVSDGKEIKPVVLFQDRLYLQRYFKYETIILNRVKAFIESERTKSAPRLLDLKKHSNLIAELFNSTVDHGENGEAINWPLVATISAVLNNFTIITGGPGTGKTTTVAKILTILFTINPGLKVALAAPTGKAAARMAESLNNAGSAADESIKSKFATLKPSTIHRLLGAIKNTPYFKHHNENTLNYDVVIADESSMIDVALFAKLLNAVAPATTLILLGDKDQLASVEAGSLFGDLCQAQNKLNSFTTGRAKIMNCFIRDPARQIENDHIDNSSVHPLFQHVVELKSSRRFSDEKGIGKFSKSIIQNNEAALREFFSNTDEQVTVDTSYSEEIFEEFISRYEAFIGEKDIAIALQKLNMLRVLCVVREGGRGLHAINKKVEKYLQRNKHIRLSGEFYEHRPIMLTSNNYELQLFNGDIGIIRPGEKGELKAWFEAAKGEIKSVSTAYIANAETVYAMTIHKSQGSEFDEVLVSLPESEDIPILTRQLLYTAVTRAKHKVIVQASESVILQASKRFVKRGSGIIERFTN